MYEITTVLVLIVVYKVVWNIAQAIKDWAWKREMRKAGIIKPDDPNWR
jgi:hypothetical protein